MKRSVILRCCAVLFLIFTSGCSLVAKPTDRVAENILSPTPAIQHSSTRQPTATSLPTLTPTATLSPMGATQTIPDGYYYLGDTDAIALGFNLGAGGAIGSLKYNGMELIDDADYGRYFQFSPYDSSNEYVCDSSSCFTTWGWNPLQAGSADGQPARVLDFRTWEDGLYIKALGMEWGSAKGESDVYYETWAWDRGGYFEIFTRLTHFGSDTHDLAIAEFPAAYFNSSLPVEYGYSGVKPFEAEEVQRYDLWTQDLSQDTNLPVVPSENWLAFGNEQGVGLILAVPPQSKLSPLWSMVFIQNASPTGSGYMTPYAHLLTLPGTVHDLHYYLIPGKIAENRAIVYDLFPHTTWTFDLNSAEGWQNLTSPVRFENGMLSTFLSTSDILTSSSNLPVYGNQVPTIELQAKADSAPVQVCVQFITKTEYLWDDMKSSCVLVLDDEIQNYLINFSGNLLWDKGQIDQIRIYTKTPSNITIDQISFIHESYGWEFSDSTEGWAAYYDMGPLTLEDGALTSYSTGFDPYMGASYLGINAEEFSKVEIRMKTENGVEGKIYFVTDRNPNMDESTSMGFPLINDGEYHTYKIDLSDLPAWKDTITVFRLDPTDSTGKFQIDYIRILRSD